MKNIKDLTDEELLKQMEKADDKIYLYKNLILLAAILGAGLILLAVITGIFGVFYVAKSCLWVAALQSLNICLFLGLGYKWVKKEAMLSIEHLNRRQKQEAMRKKEVSVQQNLTKDFEKSKSQQYTNDDDFTNEL